VPHLDNDVILLSIGERIYSPAKNIMNTNVAKPAKVAIIAPRDVPSA
jgi:hypothetical protein